MKITRIQFAALHRKISETCFPDPDQLKEAMDKPDYILYGYNQISDSLLKYSISEIIRIELKEDGRVGGKVLRNTKVYYNKNPKEKYLFIGDRVLRKFFRFIGIKNLDVEKLNILVEEYDSSDKNFPPRFINKNEYHNTGIGSMGASNPRFQSDEDPIDESPTSLRLKDFIRSEELIEHIKSVLEDSKWVLYTYNFDYDTIVAAFLKFSKIETVKNQLSLSNPKRGYDYEGVLNLEFSERDIIIIDLYSKVLKKKHIHLKMNLDFYFNKTTISVGKALSFGQNYTIVCCNAVLLKMADSKEYEKGYFYTDSANIHKGIQLYLSPKHFGYKICKRKKFEDLDDLQRYLENESQMK